MIFPFSEETPARDTFFEGKVSMGWHLSIPSFAFRGRFDGVIELAGLGQGPNKAGEFTGYGRIDLVDRHASCMKFGEAVMGASITAPA